MSQKCQCVSLYVNCTKTPVEQVCLVWTSPIVPNYRVETGDPRVRVFDSETSHIGVEFHGVCDKINICSVG